MWLSVQDYSKQMGISKQRVYEKIKAGKLKVQKDEKNHSLIYYDGQQIEQAHDQQTKIESQEYSLQKVEDHFKGFIFELNKSHERELETIKQSKDEIIRMKDSEIARLNKENEQLKKKKSGLFGFFQ